jgi:uncharacterized protein (DUF983 family)
MIPKGTKLYSILKGYCPKCQNESMYVESNPYKIIRVLKMHEQCSHCNTKYSIEPSFFYGSMYVSYAVGVAFATAAFLVSFLLLDFNLLNTFFSIVATLFFTAPIIMRLARNIWINLFMSYSKDLDKAP